MELRRITEITSETSKNKMVICVGKNIGYLNYLKEKFNDLYKKIDVIIDFNISDSELVYIDDRCIKIRTIDYLSQVDCDRIMLVILDDFYEEVFARIQEYICENNLIRNASYKIYFSMDYISEIEFTYRDKYQDDLLENIIIFRSGPHESTYVKGMDFSDNSRALFEYMLTEKYNDKYKLVWLVKNSEDKIFNKYKNKNNVIFLSYDWAISDDEHKRDMYYSMLYHAKYLFFTDSYGFAKNCRKDQKRIQLWHGCGFKTRINFGSCEYRYDYTTVVSDLYKEIHKQTFGLRENQVLVTGYAKHDWFSMPYEQGISEIFDIKVKPNKFVFWLPTFRNSSDSIPNSNQYEINVNTGLPIIENISQMKGLNNILAKKNMFLLIKPHPFQNISSLTNEKFENIRIITNDELVEKDIMINRLLASANALISDYSSVAIDFLNMDKPIAFTVDDLDEYKNSRGFEFDNVEEWFPGKEIFNFNDFCEFIIEIASGIDSSKRKRQFLSPKLVKYKDDKNCQRICHTFDIVL